MSEESSSDAIDQFYIFPDEFEALREPLQRTLEKVFMTGPYGQAAFFRGMFFTSSLQEGRAIPQAIKSVLGGVADLALAVLLAAAWRLRLLGWLQLGLVTAYTVTFTVLSPDLWLLPLGMYDLFDGSWNHIALIPTTAVIALMLFGIEELGTQLAEPFTVLPMQVYCDRIYNWCMEIMSWQPGDNGRPMKPVKPEHKYFLEKPVDTY